tara:strand:- start:3337 stop:4899 length:1563 start_codon:yes stop_codon:yes gene_type:complete
MKYGALDSLPRQTTIGGQPHMLAYINPEEEGMIQDYRGNIPPVAGPDGVPAYIFHSSWGGGSKSTADTSSKDDKPSFSISNVFSSIGNGISSAVSSVVSGVSDFVSDVGQAAGDTIKEVVTLGAADTQTYNSSDYNLDYDATGGNTTAATTTAAAQVFYDSNGVSHSSQAAADAANAAIAASGKAAVNPYKEYADSMTEAGILSLGGKQMPNLPNNQGNTPILKYTGTGSDGQASYEVVGGLDADNPASMSYNEDGTLFVPYDGQDPNSIDANTQFYGSTDPNASDYNMSLDLAQTGSYVNLDGEIVKGEPFETDLPINGAAILNELGKDHLLKTGDDSKMITTLDGGGYTFLGDDKKITDDVFEEIIDVAIEEELLPPEILGPEIIDPPIVLPPIDESQPYSTNLYGSRDFMGDFYGGRSGGIWDRFSNSYLTRFGYSPEEFNEMIRKVENPDGSTNFFGADGQLINPESIGSNYRIFGDPTTLKIGEEQTTVGQQNYDAQGNLIDTTYYEGYGAQDLT